MKNLMKTCLLTLILLNACTPEDPSCDILYFNSFESQSDFEGFEGYAGYQSDDVPANAGDSCLVVCGGCIVPHLHFDVGPFEKTMELSVSLMGKSDLGGGLIIRSVSDPAIHQMISIGAKEWTHYQTEENMILPAADTLRIEIQSGGIIPVTTFIDLLTVNCEMD